MWCTGLTERRPATAPGVCQQSPPGPGQGLSGPVRPLEHSEVGLAHWLQDCPASPRPGRLHHAGPFVLLCSVGGPSYLLHPQNPSQQVFGCIGLTSLNLGSLSPTTLTRNLSILHMKFNQKKMPPSCNQLGLLAF